MTELIQEASLYGLEEMLNVNLLSADNCYLPNATSKYGELCLTEMAEALFAEEMYLS